MKIATWNVNSIRARLHLVPQWLVDNQIDAMLIQEIKCINEAFPYEIFEDMGYNCVVFGQKSMNGVAIVTKYRPLEQKLDIPLYEYPDRYQEARYAEVKVDYNGQILRLASIYFPNGNPPANYEGIGTQSPRFLYKLEFYNRFLKYISEESSLYSDEIFILGGDYNIMHNEIDVHNPNTWYGEIAFTTEERLMLSKINELGFIDAFRYMNLEAKEYTWWNYRFGGFQKDHGLRIDYIFVSKNGLNLLKSCHIDKTVRSMPRASDHVPCVLQLVS